MIWVFKVIAELSKVMLDVTAVASIEEVIERVPLRAAANLASTF